MNMITKAALIGLVLTAAACTRPDRFGGAGGGAANGGGAFDPNAATNLGGANDPTSPLFFNQTIGDRVLFAVDTSTLTEQGKQILIGQARWLQTNADYLAIIEGHADEVGTREYNIGLGFRRANAAREFLVSQGVPSDRLRVTSYGKERPIEICSDESCYAKNRRAVTVISIASLS
ncbi:MAG: peptidoglycan-associated lipoprotein Pal [Yoonia sp.]|nr:peptidoglycan-associated lipoprotein Pal [Yoonia sp.]